MSVFPCQESVSDLIPLWATVVSDTPSRIKGDEELSFSRFVRGKDSFFRGKAVLMQHLESQKAVYGISDVPWLLDKDLVQCCTNLFYSKIVYVPFAGTVFRGGGKDFIPVVVWKVCFGSEGILRFFSLEEHSWGRYTCCIKLLPNL